MPEKAFTAGDLVRIAYKTGEYVAEVVEVTPPKAVVKILAVQKHPAQGDLHHPYEVDVPLFHQRRALAFQEKVVVPLGSMQLFQGEAPSYQESLRHALEREMAALQKMIVWAQRSLAQYESLKQDYFASRS
jgi:kinase-associated protein B